MSTPSPGPYAQAALKLPLFAYRAPGSLDEALDLLQSEGEEAKPLAGGQSLLPLLAFRLARPAMLIDLAGVPGLRSLDARSDALALGAMVSEREAERSAAVRDRAPLLKEALFFVGHPAIRSRGTVGGSLAHADPAAELPAVAVALEARMVLQSSTRGQRELSAGEFFRGYFTTALESDELLTAVRIPAARAGTGFAFEEAARQHGDFAMVGVAAMVRLASERVADARLALTGVAEIPLRLPQIEAQLAGATCEPATFEEAASAVALQLSPPSDLHGSSEYRRHVAKVLVRRALERAARRAGSRPADSDQVVRGAA